MIQSSELTDTCTLWQIASASGRMKGAQDMGVCVQEWTGRKVARMSDFVSWSACLTSICSKLHKYNLGFLADWESPLHFLTSDIKP